MTNFKTEKDINMNPLTTGTKVFIRTVTYHYTGEIVQIDDASVVLKHASWIADSGRWAHAMRTGELLEIEPYPDDVHVVVARGAIVDAL